MSRNYLFVPYSTPGHVHPMLPLMTALAERGAAVRALVAIEGGLTDQDVVVVNGDELQFCTNPLGGLVSCGISSNG